MIDENHSSALSGVKVLIVDDDAETAEVFSLILETEGAIVITAASVEEGLQHVREQHPDILITDHLLTDGSGVELLARVRSGSNQESNDIPAISITGVTRLGEITTGNEMRAAGFSAFLAKPVEVEDLVSTVIKLVATDLGLNNL